MMSSLSTPCTLARCATASTRSISVRGSVSSVQIRVMEGYPVSEGLPECSGCKRRISGRKYIQGMLCWWQA